MVQGSHVHPHVRIILLCRSILVNRQMRIRMYPGCCDLNTRTETFLPLYILCVYLLIHSCNYLPIDLGIKFTLCFFGFFDRAIHPYIYLFTTCTFQSFLLSSCTFQSSHSSQSIRLPGAFKARSCAPRGPAWKFEFQTCLHSFYIILYIIQHLTLTHKLEKDERTRRL